MTDPLPDMDLGQIERRALRALDAAPPPWVPFLETKGGLGGASFIRLGDDPDVDQEMYLDVYDGGEHLRSPVRLDPIVEFVACAPEDVIRLIAEIRRLRGQPALCTLILRRERGIVVIRAGQDAGHV